MKEKLSTKESLSQLSLEDAMVELENMRTDNAKLISMPSNYVWSWDVDKVKAYLDKIREGDKMMSKGIFSNQIKTLPTGMSDSVEYLDIEDLYQAFKERMVEESAIHNNQSSLSPFAQLGVKAVSLSEYIDELQYQSSIDGLSIKGFSPEKYEKMIFDIVEEVKRDIVNLLDGDPIRPGDK
jgi:hypothetical protein